MEFEPRTDAGEELISHALAGWLRPLLSPVVGALEGVQVVIDRLVAQAHEALSPARAWLAANGPKVGEALLAIQRFSAEARVENWAELNEDEWIAALALTTSDESVPLAWVPPAGVVKQLLAATNHEARDEVLLRERDAIGQRARLLLGEVTHPQLSDLKGALSGAWDAWDSGNPKAAQALAAACVGEVVDAQLGFRRFASFRDEIEPWRSAHPEYWRVTQYRVAAVMCSLGVVVEHTDRGLPGFNRHASLHSVDRKQYTPPNALRGLMVATSAARELQFHLSEEWTTSGTMSVPHVVGRAGGVAVKAPLARSDQMVASESAEASG
ncbi:MAG: hypothetical protein ACR2GG_07340 [Gemmatimonadaceae bacterium]